MATMKKIKVDISGNSYEIRVGADILSRAGLWLKEKGLSGKAVIVTDTTVKGLYASSLEQGLTHAGFRATVLEVPAGEEQKSLETAGKLYHSLAEAYAERTTTILALGGGMVGDLAGFVAATYMRGVPLVQVPTTLLAQVDSSIGGKTGVDFGSLKNIIGAFYQPVLVVADMDTLKTLPEVELANGFVEAIKNAAVRNKDLFNYLEANMEKARELRPDVMENIVQEAARTKAEVVAKDEKETGLRAILNYGHTVGHAVEAISGFRVKHGQAVAIGMMAAAKISRRMGLLQENELVRLDEVIRRAGLSTKMPDLTREEKEKLLQVIKHDKKVRDGRLRFVLLKSIGNAFVSDEVEPGLIGEELFGWRAT
jgi:3-dehydroquinate synthase